MEILRNNQNNARDKNNCCNCVTEVKDVFDGLVSRLDMAEERVCELEDISGESILKTQKAENKDCNKIKKTE